MNSKFVALLLGFLVSAPVLFVTDAFARIQQAICPLPCECEAFGFGQLLSTDCVESAFSDVTSTYGCCEAVIMDPPNPMVNCARKDCRFDVSMGVNTDGCVVQFFQNGVLRVTAPGDSLIFNGTVFLLCGTQRQYDLAVNGQDTVRVIIQCFNCVQAGG